MGGRMRSSSDQHVPKTVWVVGAVEYDGSDDWYIDSIWASKILALKRAVEINAGKDMIEEHELLFHNKKERGGEKP